MGFGLGCSGGGKPDPEQGVWGVGCDDALLLNIHASLVPAFRDLLITPLGSPTSHTVLGTCRPGGGEEPQLPSNGHWVPRSATGWPCGMDGVALPVTPKHRQAHVPTASVEEGETGVPPAGACEPHPGNPCGAGRAAAGTPEPARTPEPAASHRPGLGWPQQGPWLGLPGGGPGQLGSRPLPGCACSLLFPVSSFSPYKSWACGPCHHIPSTSPQVASLRGTCAPTPRGESRQLVPSLGPRQSPAPTPAFTHQRKGRGAGICGPGAQCSACLSGTPSAAPAQTPLKPPGPARPRAWLLTWSHSLAPSPPLALPSGQKKSV